MMSASPSPIHSYDHFLPVDFFVANGNGQDWYGADKSCQEQEGVLLLPTEPSIVATAQIFMASYLASEDNVAGFWTGIQPDINQCQVIDQFGKLVSVQCDQSLEETSGAIYIGLCQRPSGASSLQQPYYFSCQCLEGYGFENCSKVNDGGSGGSLNFGHTFCEKNPKTVELISASEKLPLIFVDHVVFGKPFKLPNSPEDRICEDKYYAQNVDEVKKSTF